MKRFSSFQMVLGQRLLNSCAISCSQQSGTKTYKEIVGMLTNHFSQKCKRFYFHRRNHEEGKSVTMFVSASRKLTKHCEDALNDTLQDRLVCGLRNEAAQNKLLIVSDVTLEKAINISVTLEMASKEAQQLIVTRRVHKFSCGRPNAQGSGFHCGKSVHLASSCWCKDMDCHYCWKKGHV